MFQRLKYNLHAERQASFNTKQRDKDTIAPVYFKEKHYWFIYMN
jgi:hypothetical protein